MVEHMTCFWTGIVSSLTSEDVGLLGNPPTHDLPALIRRFQELAVDSGLNITWQGTDLTVLEIKEHKEAIREYITSNIGNGHLTSSCDPFLCLLADVLECRIQFRYINTMIVFETKKTVRKIIQFAASDSHFVCAG